MELLIAIGTIVGILAGLVAIVGGLIAVGKFVIKRWPWKKKADPDVNIATDEPLWIHLKVTNNGATSHFSAQVIRVQNAAKPQTPLWFIPWRGHDPHSNRCELVGGESRHLNLAQAYYGEHKVPVGFTLFSTTQPDGWQVALAANELIIEVQVRAIEGNTSVKKKVHLGFNPSGNPKAWIEE